MTDTADLIAALAAVAEAAEGDSNDAEIEALQEALDQALLLAGIDRSDPSKPRRKAQVIVIENPQEDPTWITDSDTVEVTTLSSYPFSKYDTEDGAAEAAEGVLQLIRDESSAFLRGQLIDWLRQEVEERERDFVVDWDTLTLHTAEPPESVRAALTPPRCDGCGATADEPCAIGCTGVIVGKRQCFWIDEAQDPGDRGYIPSLVTEGEPGHSPLVGNGEHAQPWYWGTDVKTARRIMDDANAKLGITREDAVDIILSSMRASNPHSR